MKTIHHFHRRLNYLSQLASRLKCEQSLAHALRLVQQMKSTKKLEWNNELSDNNLIWCNGKISKLSNWSEEDKQDLLYRMAPLPTARSL